MKIAMIGTGYVGLVSGVCLSDFGHDVICVDKDAGKIGQAPEKRRDFRFYEPGPRRSASRATSEAAGSRSPPISPTPSTEADAVFIASWARRRGAATVTGPHLRLCRPPRRFAAAPRRL